MQQIPHTTGHVATSYIKEYDFNNYEGFMKEKNPIDSGIVANDSCNHKALKQSQGLKIWGKDSKGYVYFACINCGTTKRKYQGHGLCEYCFKRRWIQIKNPYKKLMGKFGGWSYEHDKCIECGTTQTKHRARGLCMNCYNLILYHKKYPNAGTKGNPLNGKWSRKYNCCIECGTTEKKHQSNGLCETCYKQK